MGALTSGDTVGVGQPASACNSGMDGKYRARDPAATVPRRLKTPSYRTMASYAAGGGQRDANGHKFSNISQLFT